MRHVIELARRLVRFRSTILPAISVSLRVGSLVSNDPTWHSSSSTSGSWECPSPPSLSVHFLVIASLPRLQLPQNESIPHIMAALLTHFLSAAWGAYQIYSLNLFKNDYVKLISNGACAGAPHVLEDFWDSKMQSEIASLVFNVVGLLMSAGLTWYLLQVRRAYSEELLTPDAHHY